MPVFFFLFKQKTAYDMRISDWSSDVCSSDLRSRGRLALEPRAVGLLGTRRDDRVLPMLREQRQIDRNADRYHVGIIRAAPAIARAHRPIGPLLGAGAPNVGLGPRGEIGRALV